MDSSSIALPTSLRTPKLSSPAESKSYRQFINYLASSDASSSGIGRSVAVLFAREGADVTIVYLPEEQGDAEETKKMVEKEGRKCVLFPGNLMDNETCKKAVQKHVDEFGKIDVLVNNAAKQIMCEDFKDIDLENVESTFRSNILQIFAMTKYALHHMEKGGS